MPSSDRYSYSIYLVAIDTRYLAASKLIIRRENWMRHPIGIERSRQSSFLFSLNAYLSNYALHSMGFNESKIIQVMIVSLTKANVTS